MHKNSIKQKERLTQLRKEFADWSHRWKSLRKYTGNNINGVLNMWNEPPPSGCLRETWNAPVGYRKNDKGKVKGEQQIEKLFLPQKDDKTGKTFDLKRGSECLKVTGFAHNFPMSKFRSGQVIADCTAFIDCEGGRHPLSVEVKVQANNPWFAVVENLQQVKMLRSNPKAVVKCFGAQSWAVERGAYGMVLAPSIFYTHPKRRKMLALTNQLLDALQSKGAKARIILASSDNLAAGTINYIDGYWPSR